MCLRRESAAFLFLEVGGLVGGQFPSRFSERLLNEFQEKVFPRESERAGGGKRVRCQIMQICEPG